jgi:starvation-inducible DNA-binding protein
MKATSHKQQLLDTKNDLEKGTRQRVVEILNTRLADAIDLQYAVRTAHWNVKGPSFGTLHRLFDEVHEFLNGAIDTIAERVVQLGGTAMGTARIAAEKSNLEEYPTDIYAGLDHVEAVSDRMALFGKLMRENIDEAEDIGDKDTSDLLIDLSRENDKYLWMVEAHNQADR